MAKNITLMGASYTDVPAVTLPQTGGGTALFTDVGDTTATPSDVASGKKFYAADGTEQTGTAIMGGGNDFIITLTKNASTGIWEPDCTFAEAQAAYSDGKNVAFEASLDGSSVPCGEDSRTSSIIQYFVLEPVVTSNYFVFNYFDYVWDRLGINAQNPYPYYDTSSATAAPADVASGKVFYNADGYQVGTASGGGSSPWTHILTQEIAVSTEATSAKAVATIAGGSAISTADKIVWVHIRDKAGERAGYFYGSDAFFINYIKANDSDATFTYPAVYCIHVSTSGTYESTIGQYGVYGYSISNEGSLIIRRRYSSTTTLTIDGTFQVDVYTLDLPDGLTLFD